jgi:hypothetical protein
VPRLHEHTESGCAGRRFSFLVLSPGVRFVLSIPCEPVLSDEHCSWATWQTYIKKWSTPSTCILEQKLSRAQHKAWFVLACLPIFPATPSQRLQKTQSLTHSPTQGTAINLDEIKRFEVTEVYSHPDAKVDIVFVHGLNGGPRHTWTSKGPLETFWPTQLLPVSLKSAQARILVYGYNADVYTFGSSKSARYVLNLFLGMLRVGCGLGNAVDMQVLSN